MIKTHIIYALAVGLLVLLSGIAVDDFSVRHQAGGPTFIVGFEDENLKQPVAQFSIPFQAEHALVRPGEWFGIRAKAKGYTPIVRWAPHYELSLIHI